ncbi:MAG TPA: hypothetical protein VEW48_25190 [Thermoanaerobaculia bacterium]|nr:hypothetical protein [Thermoanaerobaculia bacterium]
MMDDKAAVLVDTNVLLSATAPFRPLHRAALVVLNDWPNQGTVLAASLQVFREYLAVATRPVDLGKQVHDANLVATALASGVTRLVTANCGDFSRFSKEIEILDLSGLASETAASP